MDRSLGREAISAEMLQLLVDIGYVATGCGRKKTAERIFEGVLAARPENEYVYIAYAFMHMVFGEYTAASKLLVEGALHVNPESEMAKAFYGFMLHQVGQRSQSHAVLEEVSAGGHDPDAVKLATKIIKEG
ncbi:MAG: HrpB1 family type III secretion system apparatus protein [Verrucomicrobiota bacterium]|nr:MAG: HrpB1 family type III secretion system apparatus protein [Verrucomicrobiota bacterium]